MSETNRGLGAEAKRGAIPNRLIMIDIETLATVDKAAVLSLAATIGDPMCDLEVFAKSSNHTFCTPGPSVSDQVKMGRVVDSSTLKWWVRSSQSSKELARLLTESERPDTPTRFMAWVKRVTEEADLKDQDGKSTAVVCSCGPTFDISIVRSLVEDMLGSDVRLFGARQERDFRTYCEVFGSFLTDAKWGYEKSGYVPEDPHYADEDALRQWLNVARGYQAMTDEFIRERSLPAPSNS